MIWISVGLAVLSAVSAVVAGVIAHRGRVKMTEPEDGYFTLTVADDGFPWVLSLTIGSAFLAALSALAGALATALGV